MSQLAFPAPGSKPSDVLVKLRVGQKVKSHNGSNPSELAARVLTEGTYVDSRNEVEFADAIKGPPGDPGIHGGSIAGHQICEIH